MKILEQIRENRRLRAAQDVAPAPVLRLEFRNDHGDACTCMDCVMRRRARGTRP